MVRLRAFTFSKSASAVLFQFLHGAIKGFLFLNLILMPDSNFNSYMVRLRDSCNLNLLSAIQNFNSYMVRLRELTSELQQDFDFAFQFLHGAIKGYDKNSNRTTIIYISIPTWCD